MASPQPTHADVLVIGGGISGLVAADVLSRAGHSVIVIEASDQLGGMHRSVEIGPYTFDLGSIFYEENARLLELAPGLDALCPQVRRLQRRISPEGEICHYPIELRDILNWPKLRLVRALAGLLFARAFLRRDGTLEAACRKRLGRPFFVGTGLRNYVARFNVSPPETIDEEFFFHRMKFVHQQTDFGALARSVWRSLRHGSLRARPRKPLRIRPRAGYRVLFDRIRRQLEASGVRFVLQAPVTRIAPEGTAGAMQVDTAAGSFVGRTVIGAASVEALHQALFGTATRLETLSLITLFVSAGRFSAEAGNVFFNFHREGRWKRMTFYSRLYPDPAIAREYFSVEATALPGETLTPERVFDEMRALCTRLGIAEDLRLEGAVTTPEAYPLYRPGQLAEREAIIARIVQAGVIPVGRQGRFEYLPTSSGVARRVREELERAGLVEMRAE